MSSSDDISLKVTMVSPVTGKLTTEVEHNRVRISLTELVQNTRPPPLSSQNFLDFLKKRYTEESFLFLKATNEYHRQVNKAMLSEELGPEVYDRELESCWELAHSIYEHHIVAGSDVQVNMSFTIVDSIKADLENKTNIRSIFDDAEKEAEALILSQGFVHQFISDNIQNINSAEKSRRRKIGVSLYILGVLYLCLLEFFISISPWYRLFGALIFTFGTLQLLSAQMGLCVFLAKQRRRMTDDGRFSFISTSDDFSDSLEGMLLSALFSFSLSLSFSSPFLSRSGLPVPFFFHLSPVSGIFSHNCCSLSSSPLPPFRRTRLV